MKYIVLSLFLSSSNVLKCTSDEVLAQSFKKDKITKMSWQKLQQGVKFTYFSPAYDYTGDLHAMHQGEDVRCIINDYGQIEQFRFPIHSTLAIKIFTHGFDDLD